VARYILWTTASVRIATSRYLNLKSIIDVVIGYTWRLHAAKYNKVT